MSRANGSQRGVLAFEDFDSDFVVRRAPPQYTAAASYPQLDAQEAAAFPEDVDVDPKEGFAVGPWGHDPHALSHTSHASEQLDASEYASEELVRATGGLDDERRRAAGSDFDAQSGHSGEGRLRDDIPRLRARSRYPEQASGHDAPMLEDAESERAPQGHRFRLASAVTGHAARSVAKRPLESSDAPEGRDVPLSRLPARGGVRQRASTAAGLYDVSSTGPASEPARATTAVPRVPRRTLALSAGLSLAEDEEPASGAVAPARRAPRQVAGVAGVALLSLDGEPGVTAAPARQQQRSSAVTRAAPRVMAVPRDGASLLAEAPHAVATGAAASRAASGRGGLALALPEPLGHARGEAEPRGGQARSPPAGEGRGSLALLPLRDSFPASQLGARLAPARSEAALSAGGLGLALLPIDEAAWPRGGASARPPQPSARQATAYSVPLLPLGFGEQPVAPLRAGTTPATAAGASALARVGEAGLLGARALSPLLHALPTGGAVLAGAASSGALPPAHGEPGHVCSQHHSPATLAAGHGAASAASRLPLASSDAAAQGARPPPTSSAAAASVTAGARAPTLPAAAPAPAKPARRGLARPAAASSAGALAPAADEPGRGARSPVAPARHVMSFRGGADIELDDPPTPAPPRRAAPAARERVSWASGAEAPAEEGDARAPPRRGGGRAAQASVAPAAAAALAGGEEGNADATPPARSARRAPARAEGRPAAPLAEEAGQLAPPPRSRPSLPASARSGAAGAGEGEPAPPAALSRLRRGAGATAREAQAGNLRPDTRSAGDPTVRRRSAAPEGEDRVAHSDAVASTDERAFRGTLPPRTLVFRGEEG